MAWDDKKYPKDLVLSDDWNNMVTDQKARETARDISFYRRKEDAWYSSPNAGTALTTGAPTANNLRVIPFVCAKKITIDRIAINVTALVAGKVRMGIYQDNGDLYPETLILDAGEVDTGTTGVKEIEIDLTLNENTLYWLAIVGNAASTIRCFAVAGLIPILGLGIGFSTAWSFGWVKSFTYDVLPTPFPSGASLITGVPIPGVFVRLKL